MVSNIDIKTRNDLKNKTLIVTCDHTRARVMMRENNSAGLGRSQTRSSGPPSLEETKGTKVYFGSNFNVQFVVDAPMLAMLLLLRLLCCHQAALLAACCLLLAAAAAATAITKPC